MNETPDPERLLAEALRAQAVRAPIPPGTPPSTGATDSAVSNAAVSNGAPSSTPSPDDPVLQLFSGTDVHPGLLSGRAPETDGLSTPVAGLDRPTAVTDSRYTARLASPAPLPVGWIITLALLLGLAAGAVVGLVSVL